MTSPLGPSPKISKTNFIHAKIVFTAQNPQRKLFLTPKNLLTKNKFTPPPFIDQWETVIVVTWSVSANGNILAPLVTGRHTDTTMLFPFLYRVC